MKFLRLSEPGHVEKYIYVNMGNVLCFDWNADNTILELVNGRSLFVIETPDEIMAMLKA